MTDRVFVDTNVLIYGRDSKEGPKRDKAREWLSLLADSRRLVLNLQVINELTRWILRNEPKRPLGDTQTEVTALRAYGDAPIDEADVARAWDVRRALGYQWFDCLLVASASSQCRYFLSEDMGHMARFEKLTIIDPFRIAPNEL